MKRQTYEMLRTNPIDFLFDNIDVTHEKSFIQDVIHIETKMRNRMLKPSVCLPMGTELVSVAHLKVLITTVPKEVHGLVRSDICPEDRQNFRSLEKCFNDRVLNALAAYVAGSESTIMYLKICREIYSAFTETNMKPLDRVKLMWHATYFIRAWRVWILENEAYCLQDNFISSPTYSCIELNAYGLLHLIRKFRASNRLELFITMLFSSQTCEQTFRQLRSMTSIFWTKINFSLLELMHMVGRLELSNEIVYDKLSSNVNFPRVQNRIDKCIIYDLPTNEELKKALEEAKSSALSDSTRLGMNVDTCKIDLSGFKKGTRSKRTMTSIDDSSNSECDEDCRIETGDDHESSFLHTNLEQEKLSNSKYIEIKERDGSVRTVLKSSVIWALTETKDMLSKDRLKRVQSPSMRPGTPTPQKSSRKRRINDINEEHLSKRRKENEAVYSAKELTKGEITQQITFFDYLLLLDYFPYLHPITIFFFKYKSCQCI